jgi:TatD DNase family protein
MIVDTHCHLDFDAFDEDRDDVLARAAATGVRALVLIGIHPISWRGTAQLAASYPAIVRAVGYHPTSVSNEWSADAWDLLRDELRGDDIVALGEIGLDFYRGDDNRVGQAEAFRAQLDLARTLELPVVIHQRAAEEETLRILSEYTPCRGVMHCFGGDRDYAERCLALGMHLGIGGVATFKRSDDVRDSIAAAPLDRLVIETDAPFLAPQAHRGARNEPAYLEDVVRVIANVRGSTADAIAEATTSNAASLFGDRLRTAVDAGLDQRA